MQGYDYGVRPRIAIQGDIAFLEPWANSDYVANAYNVIPKYGSIVAPPSIAMMFNNVAQGKRLFRNHFLKWVENANGDGDAVGIDFIEWFDGQYTMIVYQEMSYVFDRLIPKHLTHEDAEFLCFDTAKGKQFTSKEHFVRFKERVENSENSPVLFLGGTFDELFEDCTVIKSRVNFYDEGDIPPNSHATMFARRRDMNEHSRTVQSRLEPITKIHSRRKQMQSKYFPITLEQLRVSEKFARISRELISKNYEQWQITQAICNLALSLRLLNRPYYNNDVPDKESVSIFELLETYLETPNLLPIPEKVFEPGMIAKQIMLDSLELLRSRKIAEGRHISPKAIQSLMRRSNLL